MGIQGIFAYLSGFVFCFAIGWTGPSAAHAGCFDFNAAIVKPLHEPLARAAKGDAHDVGMLPDQTTYAAVRGTVSKPIDTVLKLLLDHNNTKSVRAEADVQNVTPPPAGDLALHVVKFTVKPFPLVRVTWTEKWAYTLTSGTPEKPASILISYEKVEGTNYISHLCGSMVLRKLDENTTDVFLYEQAKATQRTKEETLSGLAGTLTTLRK